MKWEDEEEGDIHSYWMALWKREDTKNIKRKHYITFYTKSLWKRLWTCYKTVYTMNE
jgi:hypothetical protein